MTRVVLNRCSRVVLLVLTALALSSCFVHRSMVPLPEDTKAELQSKGLEIGAPVYVRVFKLENEMEVWLRNSTGRYTHFRTYPICNWSGKLGPKLKEGDKQAPEGFYVVSAKQMNPNSQYHLSFNMGFPNAYDKSHGRTGSLLMVHGGCRSVGCYAITDDAITELFILAREAFTKGQRDFPIAAFPFRLTDYQMAQSQTHPWIDFWRNLKQGYDLFEANRRPPIAGVQNGRYVFFADESVIPPEQKALFTTDDPAQPGAIQLILGWD